MAPENEDMQLENDTDQLEALNHYNHHDHYDSSVCNRLSTTVSSSIKHQDHDDLPMTLPSTTIATALHHVNSVTMNGRYCNGHAPTASDNNSSTTLNGKVKSSSSGRHSNGSANGKLNTAFKSDRASLYEEAPYHIALLCYISYAVLIIFGYLRDFMRNTGLEKNRAAVESNREGYTQLYKNFESFYTRNIYRRIRDAWNRPIASVPGAYIDIIDRVSHDANWTFEYPGTKHRVVNLASYNYLGFAENSGPIHEQILETISERGVSICSTRNEIGISLELQELEQLMARFLGVESCIVFGMGFATNSTNIQCFVKKGCLILSDELNHASLILGCRLSGATIRVFKHNDMQDLERKVRKYIVEGQPRTHRPWKKIIILVEGIYSMEGTIVNLPELIRIKRQYKCYLYLDEAHSIGAMGSTGRGVVDYYNQDPRDVDIMMGTFTKSFGAAGGFIAGTKQLVDYVRINSYGNYYANPISMPVAKQIYCVIQTLLGVDGTNEGRRRIEQLARNSRYFRRKLLQKGFIIYGNDDSPVVPLLICFCSKITAVVRMAYDRGLGFIGAGFPATPLTTGRVRFCVSASHTKEMLDNVVEVMDEIGDAVGVKYSRRPRKPTEIVY